MTSASPIGIGLSVTSHHPGLAPSEAVAVMIARAEAAAGADLDHLTLGDQHRVGPQGSYLQGVPMLARLLAHWPAEKAAGLLFLLPLWHPVLVAELVGTLAAMTSSRLILQTGIGSGASQFAAFGQPLETRGTVTDEAIGVISDLLSGQTVTSEQFGIEAASIGPIPSAPVEWWIGSGRAPRALARAAGLGDALYLSPSWTLDETAEIIANYRRACEHVQRRSRVVLRRDVLVGDDDSSTTKIGDQLASAGYRGMRREVLICGGIARCVDLIGPFVDLGVTDIVARTPSVDQTRALRSIGLLGAVRSHLNA